MAKSVGVAYQLRPWLRHILALPNFFQMCSKVFFGEVKVISTPLCFDS